MISGEAVGHLGGSPLVMEALNAGLGGILGLFIGLSWAEWRSGRILRVSESVCVRPALGPTDQTVVAMSKSEDRQRWQHQPVRMRL